MVAIPCELGLDDGSKLSGRVVNLSRSGALIVASLLPPAHRPVRLRLREPLWHLPIATRGVVARRIQGRRPEDTETAVGVWFRGLTGFQQYLIAELLKQREPAMPAPRPRPAMDPLLADL